VNVTWTEQAILELGVKTTVETAGSIFGLSRTQSYEAIKKDRFPVPVLHVGRRLIVPTAAIRRALCLDMGMPGPAPPSPGSNTMCTPDTSPESRAAS
jgi:hypothetical protein